MAIDITPKSRPTTDFQLEKNKIRVLEGLPDFSLKQKKFEADVKLNIDWQPTFSRIKILPDPESISSIIDTAGGRETVTRGTIVAIGPEVGKRNGVQVEKFWVGQRVLYMASHVMRYEGANGVVHHFLKENSDTNSIIAIEPAPKE